VPQAVAGKTLEILAGLALEIPRELVLLAGGPSSLEAVPDSPAVFNVTVVYQGAREEAERLIRPLLALPVARNGLAPMSYIEVQEMSGRLPFGLRNYWKGHFIRDLDAAVIDASVAAMAGRPGPPSFLLLEAMTGAAREEPLPEPVSHSAAATSGSGRRGDRDAAAVRAGRAPAPRARLKAALG